MISEMLRNIAKNCLPEYEARFVLYAADKIEALRAENERLKAEVERLQISEVEQIARNISEMRAIQVRAENERLTKALDDYHATFERVMNEQCPTDEKHCGCVPILRAEIERLRGALEGYAKEDNWLNFEGHDVWQRDEPGSELATKALKGGGDECTPMTKF